MLPSEVQESVKQALAGMTEPVTVKLFVKPGDASSETMRALWGEIQATAPKLFVEESESIPPGMDASSMEGAVSELWRGGEFTGVRYLGIPSGYEFGPLIETVGEVSRGDAPEVSAPVVDWLKKLEKPLHFQVFVTPT